MGRPMNATSQQVLELRRAMMPPQQIADITGLPYKRVINICFYARHTGRKVPKGRVEGSVPAFRNVPESVGDPVGPFTYAEAKPTTLIDELRAKIREREARALAGPARRLCLLVRADGAFLAEDGMAFTPARDKAGRWTEAEIVRMRGQNPAKRALTMELA